MNSSPYYDRGEILDGALDGQHLEICWIKDQTDALLMQIEGSARVRLEDEQYCASPTTPITDTHTFRSARILIEPQHHPARGNVVGAHP